MPLYKETKWAKGKDLKRKNEWREGSLLDFIEAFAKDFPSKVDEYETLLTDNRIWKQRTVGIGVLPPERALQLGCTGPMLRGSGVEWDLRKKQPYAMYHEMDFDIPVGVNGDCYDRYLVPHRGNAPVCAHHPAMCRLAAGQPGPGDVEELQGDPADPRGNEGRHGSADPSFQTVYRGLHRTRGETYAAVEAPKGEFGCYMVSDGANKPFRVHLRAPGFAHLSAMDELVKGHMLADVVAMIGTLDIVFGEVDR